jgi:hypothetical protein
MRVIIGRRPLRRSIAMARGRRSAILSDNDRCDKNAFNTRREHASLRVRAHECSLDSALSAAK